jgi:Skp family chaperone for outer membrane proteins
MTAEVLADPVPPAESPVEPPSVAPSVAETVGFLRRLASMISVGQNAANLNHAAVLIETLMRRAVESERTAADQQAVTATYADMCKAYEVMLDRLRADAATLEARLARQSEEAAAERARLVAETEQLSTQLSRAQTERAAAAESLADLTARFSSLGESSVIVSVAALQAVRAQFDSLADEFARHGDVVALAMSDAGRCTVDQLLSEGRSEADEAGALASP